MNKKFLSVLSLILSVLLTFCSCGGSLANGDIFPEPEITTTESTQNTTVTLDSIPEYSGVLMLRLTIINRHSQRMITQQKPLKHMQSLINWDVLV